MLRVKARLETVPAAGTTGTSTGRRVVSGGAQTAHATAGESKEVIELREVHESEVLDAQAQKLCIGFGAAEMAAHATAGESQRITVCVSDMSLTFHLLIHLGVWVLLHVLVRLLCLVCLLLPPHVLLPLRPLRLLHMRAPHPCMLHALRGRTRVGLRVPREGGVPKVGFPVRPKICALSQREAGVNFWPAGGVWGQVAGSLPRRQPGTGTRQVKGSVVTPSLHSEVPGIQFVSPGYGLDIRQSMGCTKVCGTARSGVWVLNGNARTCMFPANLDHLRVEWIKRGAYETAWVTPGHDCLCSYQYGHGAPIRPQTNNAIWHGVIGLWGRVAPLLSPWCARREVPTGVNLNRYSGPSSCIRWHSDNEPLFGPQNSPKLICQLEFRQLCGVHGASSRTG